MKIIPVAHELITNMRAFFQTNNAVASLENEEPLRSELFNSDQMKRYGKSLAESHKLFIGPGSDHLLERLADNEKILKEANKLLTELIKGNNQIAPAGEWLIDNFYIIEEHIRTAKLHFPKGYSKDLPLLREGNSLGLIRICDIVLQIISHSDGRIDLDSVSRFIKSYQTVTHLQLGELWAIPIMIRLALLENIRRVSARLAIDRVDGNLADYWAGKMIESVEKDPKNLIVIIADMARSHPPIVSAFVSEMTRQLRGKGPDLALPLHWMEQQLSESGLTSGEMVDAEIQKQTADQVSISNSIGSLRFLSAMDWRDFIEAHSIVEQTLREDNGAIYGAMDFSTRDRYRHVVEDIAKNSPLSEHEVACIAIKLMHENARSGDNDVGTSHVGYYLIGHGVRQTKKLAQMHESAIQRIRQTLKTHIVGLYFSFIFLVTLAITIGVLILVYPDTNSNWTLWSIAFLLLLCTSQLSISVINFFSTLLVKPDLLPRMDYSSEIPPEFRTLVVIPSMLANADEIENLAEGLEVRFLANRNNNLHFGLLTDFTDSPQQTLPADQALLDLTHQKIDQLNKKYNREKSDLFFLFHRPRHWNSHENTWMGYERKRGKLTDLNSLLRGGSKESFSLIVGDQSIFPNIKYVITLDADTQLPLSTAWKLVGTMAHPLNHPWYNSRKKRITKGYGILQPRVTVSLPDTNSTLFARMHGNEPGIDPYTRASSDVYQDLFAEGSFIGKGIYEIDAFKKVLDGKFPENNILSHDLLEGCYVRSGLLSDVQLFEKYPTTYRADMKMHSRWTRGDWQIFAWIFPWVTGHKGYWYKNPISGLSRWKIFDNVRRSLVPVALTVLLLLGSIASHSFFMWIIAVLGIIFAPIIITSLLDLIRKPKEVIILQHLRNTIRSITEIFGKTLFMVICLPYEAYSNLSAIARTIWRMLITRKKLLEWNPSANEKAVNHTNLFASYASMWIQPFLSSAVFVYLVAYLPAKIIVAGPLMLLWFVAPVITWRLGQPLVKSISKLTEEQNIFLRKLSRKTWSFFERFVGPEDNWLPPDNFQEQPIAQLAHRTSPTNIGLSLLAGVTAAEFGYITTGQLIELTTRTIHTMKKMERYRGHFYNWYDTQSLDPLFPKYISTVDSGNLAGHLLTLRQGMLAISHQKIPRLRLFEGLRDTLGVLTDTLDEKDIELLKPFKTDLENACNSPLIEQVEMQFDMEELTKKFISILPMLNNDPESETYWWKQLLNKQLEYVSEELKIFTPWILLKTAPSQFKTLGSTNVDFSLIELLESTRELQAEMNLQQTYNNTPGENEWLELFKKSLITSIRMAQERITAAEDLAQQCIELADMEWDFLYDNSRNLLTIGYNVQEHKVDASYYDLLASEVRLCTFIGIAQGKLPEESWFALGRLLTNMHGYPALLSWSGSMFEYLMPLLVMPTFDNTLLDQTCKAVVKCQAMHRKAGMPWGISESGFNMINAHSQYQYRAFGYPGLGLKRGLEEDTVIAPYASALALMIAPEKACENLELLKKQGFEGRYGFYEAIDYTPSRLQRGQSKAVVYSFMAHHQGMSLLSLAYLLLDKPMQKLFESEPQFKAVLLLLQERIPKATAFFIHTTHIADVNYVPAGTETRIVNTPNTAIPEVQLLSNGRYHVMITNAGAGYSRWKDLAVTRWREDGTRDNWGNFCYIRDLQSETYWSNTHQPSLKKGDIYEAAFSLGRADFHTSNNDIETRTEIVVSPEDDIEMRRMRITNRSDIRRTLELTSYAEVVLTEATSDLSQPSFSNLFVQTEIVSSKHAILCTRRPRGDEQAPWMFHLMSAHGGKPEEVSYETDRMRFIGRGNTIANPQVMEHGGPLSGNQGSVLDPIVAIRYKIILEPDETIIVEMVTGVADTKKICQNLIDKYHDKHSKDRVFELAWTHSQVGLALSNITEADAQLFGHLASSILFANPSFRADPAILINNHRGQSGLWAYSISGDLPIILLTIEKQTNMQLVQQLVQAHAYWRLKGLAVDLVIWNEEHDGYRQDFQNEILAIIPPEMRDHPGGIFVRATDQIPSEDRILFQTVARINISDNGGTLVEQIKRKPISKLVIPRIVPTETYKPIIDNVSIPKDLIFFNGFGGFSPDGNEYVIVTGNKNKTPAPWVNVIANPEFGTVISESGSAYTWTENAHELRLTPWNNDPVSDSGGEAFYLRDEESGHFWSVTPFPAGGKSDYITRHGFGYSIFEHIEDGIHSEMTVYVDIEAAIKFNVLKLRNQSGRPRKLSATGYIEWTLGDNRMKTAMHIHTEIDAATGTLVAKNPYSTEWSKRVAFFDVDYVNKTITADRTEFIGRNGTLKNPDAMSRIKLSGKVGFALDACAAIQVPFFMADADEQEIIFRLGAGKNVNDARALAKQFRGSEPANDSLKKVKDYWKHTTSALQVETPDAAINIITNGWLTYQTISSRLWGRSGFYQSGGAYGFRDQLQDVLSLLHIAPQLARKQILRCAAHQFKEGDVQHWWHPPVGRGVRTRISDDFLWLPLVTSLYIFHTGDTGILDESAPYLDGRQLNPGEESYFDLPFDSGTSASLYDHCVQAIKHGLNFGEHGLPLIGTGDWNDGLNKVGEDGKGESVWMAFFLYEVLNQFEKTALLYGDHGFAEKCIEDAHRLKENIDKHAWDGEWYKRAWFDSGTPLGSSESEECKIDSIAQSWSVLSGAGDPKRAGSAMEAAYERLVLKDSGIIKLLDPPFDKSQPNPGYIKGYVPGIRENGGQYTHAAIWMIMAFARLGDNKRVWELLNIINPLKHGKSAEAIAIYKVEPYVVAADVYAGEHTGRGGWTWYTGSAGWLYRLIIESFLGLHKEGDKIRFKPCLPEEWDSFKILYRYKNTVYHIVIVQTSTAKEVIVRVDGIVQTDSMVTLTDDGLEHSVQVNTFKAGYDK